MSTGSSASISVSRLLPFGGGPWSGSSDRPAPAPPPVVQREAKAPPAVPQPASASATAAVSARPIPLRPIAIPVPVDAEGNALPQAVPAHVEAELGDLSFGRMLLDALKRREFLVAIVSSAVHMVFIIALALLIMPAPKKNVIMLESSVDTEVVRPDLQVTAQVEMPPQKAAGPLIRGVSTPTAPVLAPPNLGTNPLATKTLPSLNALVLSEATKTGGANGMDAVTFFNSTVVAKRIVFIVDASTSMDGRKFERAKEELLTAVSNLNSRQRFYVYFFSDKDYPMLAPKSPTDMLQLDTKNWDAVLRWVNEQGLVGDTRPESSLRRAFRLRPDVIYLLTDGDFNDSAYSYLMGMSNNYVRINTIGFQTGPKAREVLEKIARKFRGEFTEVD